MHYVYIIQSDKTRKLYRGSTDDLKRRMGEHNIGKVNLTKALARRTEIFYKTSQGRRQLKKKLGLI